MDGFLAGALQLFELSQSAGIQAGRPGEVHILIGGECGTLIIMQSIEDWTLEALRLYYGASIAYRVSKNAHGTQIEGKSPAQSCSLGRGSEAEVWRQLMGTCWYDDHFPPGTYGRLFVPGG